MKFYSCLKQNRNSWHEDSIKSSKYQFHNSLKAYLLLAVKRQIKKNSFAENLIDYSDLILY